MTKLVQRKKGDNVFNVSFHDKVFSGGLAVNDISFGNVDRIYDSKGLETMFIKLSNIGANGIKYLIDASQVEFTNLSDLDDDDFTKTLEAQAVIAAAGDVEFTEDLLGPEITAVRIRLAIALTALNSTVVGIVSAD